MQQIDIDRARAAIVEAIGAEVELKRKGRELVGCCPFHNEKTPSFYVYPDNPHFHCFGCGAHGDAIGFAMRLRGLDFPDAVRWLLDMPADQPRRLQQVETRSPREPESATNRVRAILAECGPVIEGTAAWLYCWSRGLRPAPALLAHPALYCSEIRGPLPALVAPLMGVEGVARAVQRATAIIRIWCLPRIETIGGAGPKDSRAPLQTRKKSLGAFGNGAVRLAPAGPVLGLCEGVESGLAAQQLFRVPVWVAGGTRYTSIWVPPEVQRLIIFADRGDAGEAAAQRAVSHFSPGINCDVILPQAGDWNDELLRMSK